MRAFMYMLLILAGFSVSAKETSAAPSPLVIDGQIYVAKVPGFTYLDLKVGEQRRVNYVCASTSEGWHRTTTCTWQSVGRATEEGLVRLPDGGTTSKALKWEVVLGLFSLAALVASLILSFASSKMERYSATTTVVAIAAIAAATMAVVIAAITTTTNTIALAALALAAAATVVLFNYATWRQRMWLQGGCIALGSIGLIGRYFL